MEITINDNNNKTFGVLILEKTSNIYEYIEIKQFYEYIEITKMTIIISDCSVVAHVKLTHFYLF